MISAVAMQKSQSMHASPYQSADALYTHIHTNIRTYNHPHKRTHACAHMTYAHTHTPIVPPGMCPSKLGLMFSKQGT